MRKIYEDNHSPFAGRYKNAIVVDGLTGDIYLYDCDGIWTLIEAKNNDIDCSDELISGVLTTC